MEQFLQVETLVIALLLVVSLVAIAARRLRIPYTVALVVVGLFITFQSSLKIELTSPLILAVFLPPLVFEAGFHINFARLRRSAASILTLAVPGVILTTVIVAVMVANMTPLGWPAALVFGALIAELVMGPGGYSSRDYLRLGWPLVAITFVVVLVTAHIFWHV